MWPNVLERTLQISRVWNVANMFGQVLNDEAIIPGLTAANGYGNRFHELAFMACFIVARTSLRLIDFSNKLFEFLEQFVDFLMPFEA